VDQCDKDGIQDVIEALVDIFGQEAQDEISVLLKQGILPPVAPVTPSTAEYISPRLHHPHSERRFRSHWLHLDQTSYHQQWF